MIKRWLTLKTHRIRAMPIAILMPHSSCDCRCIMCDIWKGAGSPRQLTEEDVAGLLESLRALRTRWVVLSGGEPLLNPQLFRLCELLRKAGVAKLTLLSTGQGLAAKASEVVGAMDEVIVSLDGTEAVHDAIRRVPGAFRKLGEGVAAVKAMAADVPVSGRCVIQRLNFEVWPDIVTAAAELGLDGISFLAADLTSDAFNRARPWSERRRSEVAPEPQQLPRLEAALELLNARCGAEIESGFIVETPSKLRRIVDYYAAHHGLGSFPPVRCNAPWVSAVVEADGTVRPCFFHQPYGNLEAGNLADLVNSHAAMEFRRGLDVGAEPVCRRCVCSLELGPAESV